MKAFTKTLFAMSLFAAASAQAAIINIDVRDDSVAAASDFQSSLYSVVATEDFDDLSNLTGEVAASAGDGDGTSDQSSWVARSVSQTIGSQVGTFTLNTAGQGGSNLENDQLMIESTETGEFGRQGIADDDGYWLDSNDAKKVTWNFDRPIGSYFNAVGFFLSDASDINADLTLRFMDGTEETITFPESNGNIKFVSVTSDMNILGGYMVFDNNGSGNDGWGIDNVTLGKLPEPGTLLLMGLGLLGLGAARRRVAK